MQKMCDEIGTLSNVCSNPLDRFWILRRRSNDPRSPDRRSFDPVTLSDRTTFSTSARSSSWSWGTESLPRRCPTPGTRARPRWGPPRSGLRSCTSLSGTWRTSANPAVNWCSSDDSRGCSHVVLINLPEIQNLILQSNSVITKSPGPSKSVRYNRDSL